MNNVALWMDYDKFNKSCCNSYMYIYVGAEWQDLHEKSELWFCQL